MQVDTIPFGGWDNNLRLSNGDAEVIISLDVGPRILSYRTTDGPNVLKTFDSELGQAGEDAFVLRGGHRLWVAPEDERITYHWDNLPVTHRTEPSGEIVVTSVQEEPIRIRKDLGIRLDRSGSRVSIAHTITNLGSEPLNLATWGLTVMPAGGTEIIPQPPLGSHPEDLLPNRGVILWPYTDLSDPRWQFGAKYWFLHHDPTLPPTKVGLSHREKWIGWLGNDSLFIKTFDLLPNAAYPDGGCNFETFTNRHMTEIESLGPLVTLESGQSTSHDEHWHVFSGLDPVQITSEDFLSEWLEPFLRGV